MFMGKRFRQHGGHKGHHQASEDSYLFCVAAFRSSTRESAAEHSDHYTNYQLLLSALQPYCYTELLNQGKADEVEQAIRNSIKK